MKQKPMIDKEFENYWDPLRPEEFDLLEKDIVAHGGARDPIVAGSWPGAPGRVQMNGHTRRRICEKHGLPYKIEEISFPDREHALMWILNDQLGRRNISDNSIFLGRLYELQKGKGQSGKGQKGRGKDTAKELAEKHNVSERTVRNSASLAKAVEKLNKFCPEFEIEKKLAHKGVTKRDVIEAAKFAEKDPAKARDIVYGTRKPTVSDPHPNGDANGETMRQYADQMASDAIKKLQRIPNAAPGRMEAFRRVSQFCMMEIGKI